MTTTILKNRFGPTEAITVLSGGVELMGAKLYRLADVVYHDSLVGCFVLLSCTNPDAPYVLGIFPGDIAQ